HLGEVGDAALHLALLLLRGVVVAVLGQVAELAGGLDLAGDLDPAARRQVVVLGLEPIERSLREVVGLGHRSSRLVAAGARADGVARKRAPAGGRSPPVAAVDAVAGNGGHLPATMCPSTSVVIIR